MSSPQLRHSDDDARPARGPKAILLDVDGTLIDSNDAHARSWMDTFAEFGDDVRFETVRPLIGMGGDKLLSVAAGVEKESDEGKTLAKPSATTRTSADGMPDDATARGAPVRRRRRFHDDATPHARRRPRRASAREPRVRREWRSPPPRTRRSPDARHT